MDKNFTTASYRGVNSVTFYASWGLGEPEDYALYADPERTKMITGDELSKAFNETTIVVAFRSEGSSIAFGKIISIEVDPSTGNLGAIVQFREDTRMCGTEESYNTIYNLDHDVDDHA